MLVERKRRTTLFLLSAAVLANGAAGLLYVWSLFILPIEAAMTLNRADLGLISSLALISFTLGVSVLPIILAWIGRIPVAILAFVLISGGHIVFGVSSSWSALAVGYGFGFGTGSGLAYGFALSLAASLPDRIRAVSIGLALGAFALSGIVLPVILGNWISATAPSAAFLRIGIAALAVGTLCVMALAAVSGANRKCEETPQSRPVPISVDRPFLILALIFFFICFNGLAVVSQAAAIAGTAGISSAGYAATALTLGYLAGSLLGAPLAEQVGEQIVLLVLGSLSFLGALAMLMHPPAVLFLGATLIGLTFGGAGSIMPVLLGLRYGAANISPLYGRMIIAYGLAGLIAPGAAGLLFESAQSYGPLLGLCAAIAVLSIAFTIVLERLHQPA